MITISVVDWAEFGTVSSTIFLTTHVELSRVQVAQTRLIRHNGLAHDRLLYQLLPGITTMYFIIDYESVIR